MPGADEEPGLRLVAGLGNPGREHEGTRHNIGFLVADRLARILGSTFRPEPRWSGLCARAGELWLLKPTTFMNLAGESVAALARFHQIPPASVLVVVDDLALPLGRLRLRASGSAGGHNGLRSVISHLGTHAFPRLRIGIGAAEPGGMSGHVLGRFRKEERPAVEAAVERAAEALVCVRDQGIESAMNLFNTNHPSQPNP